MGQAVVVLKKGEGRTLKSVSYTHLDVYKRQLLQFVKMLQRQQSNMVQTAQDVYKRQIHGSG